MVAVAEVLVLRPSADAVAVRLPDPWVVQADPAGDVVPVAIALERSGAAAVVVIGVHQARDGNLQRQFFDWLLDDRPSRQDRVVFAETLTPPAPLDQAPATEALTLLSKVMLDKGLAKVVFGDPLALQSDVLGGAAEAIIATWRR